MNHYSWNEFSDNNNGHDLVPHLQAALTSYYSRSQFLKLTADTNLNTLARLTSCTAPKATQWLIPAPIGANLISNKACRTANRLRLGMRLDNSSPKIHCICGKKADSGLHFLTSNSVKGGALIRRHDTIVQTVARAIRAAGGTAHVEPRDPDELTRERFDIEASLGSTHIIVDVMVTHPTAKSNLKHALHPLGATRQGEKCKINKHESKACDGTMLVPYIVETYGGIGHEAQVRNKVIANYSDQFSSALAR